jgi:hypothetical protein
MSAVKKHRPEPGGVSDEYPEGIGERLAWFARELAIGEGRLVSLLGLVPAAAPASPTGGVDWQAVARDHEDEAWWAEAVLYEALALFDYDVKAMRQALSGSAARDYPVPVPGGVLVAASKLPPAERDRTLLTLLAAGGPAGRQALIAYLAQSGGPLPTAP